MRPGSRLFTAFCLTGLIGLVASPTATAATTSAPSARAATLASLATSASTVPASRSSGDGLFTIGTGGWQVQSTAPTTRWTTGRGATQSGAQISTPGFRTDGWLKVSADDAGAVGTEVEALVQNGVCPLDHALQPINASANSQRSVFFSDNLVRCFGAPMTSPGPDTNPFFDIPWWFRTDFSVGSQGVPGGGTGLRSGRAAKLVINGVVGQADVWVNGTEVATQATVEGDYTSYTFDITNLIKPGTNTLALELFPNNPNVMLTLDTVDWNQIAPDNNTGIQFPIQLHIADALGISNTYVTQNDAPNMASAALTVHADVTNNTAHSQTGVVTATITPPGGNQPRPHSEPISISQSVTIPPATTRTVTFSPTAFPQLVIDHPQLWWPYQMGGQPLYTLSASVSRGGENSAGLGGAAGGVGSGAREGMDSAPPVSFGIRSITTYMTAPSTMAPDGVRVFEVNGVPFDFRAGGWSENLFLHYSASDLANQIMLIKSMGLNGIRTEGKELPQNFYDQMDRAGILIDAGFQCCDKWQPPGSGRSVTWQDYHVMYLSSLAIGKRLRDHPSVLNFSWSDNNPINEQEVASLAGFAQAGFQDPFISSAEYNNSGIIGPSGQKEGPYDWVPPTYWYDTTHSSNNGNDNDSTLTNVGGSWGFDSEQSAGDTVPTMDSIKRFMSAGDQSLLWRKPDAHQFHTNYESTDGSHSGYSFGTLDNLDVAIKHRYGNWKGLAQYVEQAQVQNYEDVRAQFEAFIDHWNNFPTPSTGTDYWQLNKGWPTLLWDIYNYDYDQAGSYFGAKKANETLHVLYAYDTGAVTIDNLSGGAQHGISVESKVYSLAGQVLNEQQARGLSLAPQAVASNVLTPKVPPTTTPPAKATTYFVELLLRQNGHVVDRNVYWLSTQHDVIDWTATEGNPQANNGAPLHQYADLTALQTLPSEHVGVAAATRQGPGGSVVTSVTITNPASNHDVAFFLRADVRRGDHGGVGAAGPAGGAEVLPIIWSDNDITLWPGQSQTLTATYRGSLLAGSSPVVSVYGWNVPAQVVPADTTPAALAAAHKASLAAGIQHFDISNGTPLLTASAMPGVGAAPLTGARGLSTSHHGRRGPAWTITSVAHSPDTTPSTSFTQGDAKDTYTLTVTNTGNAPTDGTTPVILTDIVDPNIGKLSISGTGWTCSTANDPTEVCRETGGPGGKPAVLQAGQSYPPVTLSVQIPLQAGFGTQESTDGLHVTNAVLVNGGAPSQPSASLASPTPIVGVPQLTADNAVDGSFRQGDAGDQYRITVMNIGGAPTNGSQATPITATITALPAGVKVRALYGSGWTCRLSSLTCTRTDVLAGENGEEPPIDVVTSVAGNAPATGTETVQVSGGGAAGPPASVDANTAIGQAGDLHAASTHHGNFAQGDRADHYTLTVSNVVGPNSVTGGPSLGLVSVVDHLPFGLTARAISGSGWTCQLAAVTCYRTDAVAARAAYPPITLTVRVADNAPKTVTNSVTVSGGGTIADGHQTGTDPTTITQTSAAATPPTAARSPHLSVTSTHVGSFAQGDSADSYTLTVSNAAGAGPTRGMVTVADTLPAGLTPVEMSGQGWSCSLAAPTLPPTEGSRQNPVTDTFEPQPTCFRFDSLAGGTSFPPITVSVAVASDARDLLTNSASVTSGDSARVATGTDATKVRQLAQLAVSSFDSAGGVPYAPFALGGRSAGDVYHVTLANVGFAPTSGTVTFTAALPGGLSVLSMTGSGWSCNFASAICTTNPGVVLRPGAPSQLTLLVAVGPNAPQSAQTFLSVSGGGAVPGAAIDENNDYSAVTNGGVYVDPTYISLRR